MRKSIDPKIKYFFVERVCKNWYYIPKKVWAESPREALLRYINMTGYEPLKYYELPYTIKPHSFLKEVWCLNFSDTKHTIFYWVKENHKKSLAQKIFTYLYIFCNDFFDIEP